MRLAPRKVYSALMIRILLPLVCAALGFAAASCSQSEGPLATPVSPAAAASPAVHGTAAAAIASQSEASAPDADASATSDPQGSPGQSVSDPDPDAPARAPVGRRASTLIGMPVESADGSPLGTVEDIILNPHGQATHLVIAYRADASAASADEMPPGVKAAGAGRRLTAMPWDAAMATLEDGHLVLDSAKLQGAPSFTPGAWPDLDDPAWSAAADTYWRKAVRAAIAAHPGTPIDSTSRGRARPTRDGN
jgi:PRC-barrel domain